MGYNFFFFIHCVIDYGRYLFIASTFLHEAFRVWISNQGTNHNIEMHITSNNSREEKFSQPQ